MVAIAGNLVILDLGTPNTKYVWKGIEIPGVIKAFIYRGITLTITVIDKTVVPCTELNAYGIKIKEAK